jgi:hypothetical protein
MKALPGRNCARRAFSHGPPRAGHGTPARPEDTPVRAIGTAGLGPQPIGTTRMDRRNGMSQTLATPAATGALRATLGLAALFAAVRIGLHVWIGEGYGWFRDEFYYVACTERLDWGYVDHPPLSIALLKLWRALFGDSLVAIRLLPALAGAGTIVATGWMARALGGGPFAQALAMTAALVAPIHLALTGFYSMNAFDLLLWTLAALALVRILAADPAGASAADTRRARSRSGSRSPGSAAASRSEDRGSRRCSPRRSSCRTRSGSSCMTGRPSSSSATPPRTRCVRSGRSTS